MNKLRPVKNIPLGNNLQIHRHKEVIDNYDSLVEISGTVLAIEASDDWDRVDTTITQKHTGDNLLLSGGNITVSDLTSPDGTIITTDEVGKLKHASVNINEILDGSIINIEEFAIQPSTIDLVPGDLFVVDSPSTSGKLLRFFGEVGLYGIELGKV